MKKLLTLVAITLGTFALASLVSAVPVNQLQPASSAGGPASSLTVENELQVLGTARAYSVRIGAQGYGGVTFFNGTIVNETTDADSGEEQPVTFGDDVRIDGQLFRTEVGGNNSLKIADTLIPSVNNTYDLGSSSYGFKDAYFRGAVTMANLNTQTLTLTGALTGTTATLTGALAGTTATFSGDITAQGDINQSRAGYGVAKALIYFNENGTCSGGGNNGVQWTYNNSTVTCDRASEGVYTVTFAFTSNDRFPMLTPLSDRKLFHLETSGVRTYTINMYNRDGATPEDSSFIFGLF